jgi:hypothetical protein
MINEDTMDLINELTLEQVIYLRGYLTARESEIRILED